MYHFVMGVLAYHIILTFYGFWLPNDPRGSWSTEVWAAHLRQFGPPTKTETRQSVARTTHDYQLRRDAKRALLYPPVRLTGVQARAVARGIAHVAIQFGMCTHACAIMPDHVHLIVARQGMKVEDIAALIKRAVARQMNQEGIHPMRDLRTSRGRIPTCWSAGGWYVYLNSPEEIVGRIRYVNDKPVKAGLKPQCWKFVTPYDVSNK